MIQIGLLLYGLYALIAGKFTLGKGKHLRGVRARWLGLLCMANIPAAFLVGMTWGLLAAMGIASMPEGPPIQIAEFILVIINLFVVFRVGNKMYERQERDDLGEPQMIPDVAGPAYSVADPDNPFAAPSRDS